VVTGNGKPTPPGLRPQDGGAARAAAPAVVLQPGASAVFFGNIIAGNGEDQVAGLAPEKRPDLVRDNVIGLQPAPRVVPLPRPAGRGGRGM
jgi:hypothetical protein